VFVIRREADCLYLGENGTFVAGANEARRFSAAAAYRKKGLLPKGAYTIIYIPAGE